MEDNKILTSAKIKIIFEIANNHQGSLSHFEKFLMTLLNLLEIFMTFLILK